MPQHYMLGSLEGSGYPFCENSGDSDLVLCQDEELGLSSLIVVVRSANQTH
ncbi:MAG: hypothetical protein QF918_16570 [Pirellulaceae bacterium]|jgi:hypothetical protein|nr:hypothetical protein [Pirellulaceae bacterium]